MNKIITLTNGHVSIKVGRSTRIYRPTATNSMRLANALLNSEKLELATCHYTQRSSVYTITRLSPTQKTLYKAFLEYCHKERLYFVLACNQAKKENTYMHLMSDKELYMNYERSLAQACTMGKACEIVGIPHAMLYPRSNEY